MQLRLILLGVIVLAFLTLGGFMLWYRGESISAQAARDKALAELSTAVAVNKAQDETIGRLRAEDAAKDKILAEVSDNIAKINEGIADNTAAVSALKDANEDVRAYLTGVVPPNLGLQLNR
jgi:hypothetical protein